MRVDFFKLLRLTRERGGAPDEGEEWGQEKARAGRVRRGERFKARMEEDESFKARMEGGGSDEIKSAKVVKSDEAQAEETKDNRTMEVAGRDGDICNCNWTPKNKRELIELLKRTPKHVMNARERQAFSAAMSFNTVRAEELMQPRELIRMIKMDEVMGPVLLDELYRSGFDYFPVIDDGRKIVGWVNTRVLNSLEMKESRRAAELMRPEIYYVRNDYTLPQVVAAFNRTLAPFLLVIDKYERLVGSITMEVIVEFLTFQECRDDFAADNDQKLVAKRQ